MATNTTITSEDQPTPGLRSNPEHQEEFNSQSYTKSKHQNTIEDDPFATLLSLEEDYYHEGYSLGLNDGLRSGRIEGRLVGMEKGFEKFVRMGRLGGRGAVWAARLPAGRSTGLRGSGGSQRGGETDVRRSTPHAVLESARSEIPKPTAAAQVMKTDGFGLPPLSGSERLRKNIDRLIELTDPETLETKNTEDAVNECDERLAGAQTKFRLISRIVGEAKDGEGEEEPEAGNAGAGKQRVGSADPQAEGEGEVEITSSWPREDGMGKAGHGAAEAVAKAKAKPKAKAKGKAEMEDFVDLRLGKTS